MVRPERVRVSMDAPPGRCRLRAGQGGRPDLPGPVAGCLARGRRFRGTGPCRTRAGSAAAAPGDDVYVLVTGRLAGAAGRGHPDHRGSRRDARRPGPRPRLPSDPELPAPSYERHHRNGQQGSIPACSPNSLPVAGSSGGAAAAAPWVPGPVVLAACSKSITASGVPAAWVGTVGRRQAATGKLRISNWPLCTWPDGFIAAFQTATGLTVDQRGLQRQRGAVRHFNKGAAVAQGRTSAPTCRYPPVHGGPPHRPRLESTASAKPGG